MLVRPITLSILNGGIGTNPLLMRPDRKRTYPNISLLSIGAKCRGVLRCKNEVNDHKSAGEREDRASDMGWKTATLRMDLLLLANDCQGDNAVSVK